MAWQPTTFEPDTTAFRTPGIGGRAIDMPQATAGGGGRRALAEAMPWLFGAAGGVLTGLATRNPASATQAATRAGRFGAALGPALMRAGGAGLAAAGPGSIAEQFMTPELDTLSTAEHNEQFVRDFGTQAAFELGGTALQGGLTPALRAASKPGEYALKGMGHLLGKQSRSIEAMAMEASRRGVRFDPIQITQDATSQLRSTINRRAIAEKELQALTDLETEFLSDPRNMGRITPSRLYDIRKDADLRSRQLKAAVHRGDPTGDLAIKQRWWAEIANQARSSLKTETPELLKGIQREQDLIRAKEAISAVTTHLPSRVAARAIPPLVGAAAGAREGGVSGAVRGGMAGALVSSTPEMLSMLAALMGTTAVREGTRQLPRAAGALFDIAE